MVQARSMPALSRRQFGALVAAGLLLRLPGILFNGQLDLYEILLDWGEDVRAVGLVHGFSVNYGVFSFASSGAAMLFGEQMPRFWWLPYKLLVIGFECGVFAALLRVAALRSRVVVLAAYWLNPWFIWHGAYQGFWEGPHLLFALLAILALRDGKGAWPWVLAGGALFVSWQFKPHGLLHFAIPVGVLLAAVFVRGRRAPFAGFAAGFGGSALVVSLLFALAGGSLFALLLNLRSAVEAMPVVSAGGLGIWRFVSYAVMQTFDIPGEVHQLRFPAATMMQFTLAAAACSSVALLTFAVRLARTFEEHSSRRMAHLMMCAGALAVSQLGLQAHINHTYGAMVMMVPLLPEHRRLRIAWTAAAILQFLAHATRYGMGNPALLPADWLVQLYGHAQPLADRIRALPAFSTPDALLRTQAVVGDGLAALASHQMISVLGLGMFGLTLVMLHALYQLAGRPAKES